MRKLYWLLLLAAVGVFVFSGVKLLGYYRQTRAADDVNQSMIQAAVYQIKEPEMSVSSGGGSDNAKGTEVFPAPISVDFAVLQAQYPDMVGWLYSADTPINYPIMRSADNAYYLRRLPDGTNNPNGSLFMDYRNSSDFSDLHTIIYGHNMKNSYMFGTLENYREQSYYDAHPIMYLLTPTQDYQVQILGGYVTTVASAAYRFIDDPSELANLRLMTSQNTTFAAAADPAPGTPLVTLSTCSYDSEDSRYIIVGALLPVE